jgi:hypothetical protein
VTRRVQVLVTSLALGAGLVGWFGCGDDSTPVGTVGNSSLGFAFTERAKARGITFRHTDGSSGQYYIVETLGSGVGLLDFDNDGDLDIYFLNGRSLPPTASGNAAARNALYENDGNGHFSDVTDKKGVPGVGFSIGLCVGDYDGDGDLDIYVTGISRNVLYRNEGKAKGFAFTDATAEAGVEDTRFSAGCAFLDHDGDGDLDLYVSNYCEVDFATSKPCINGTYKGYCAPGQYKPVHDSFFLNEGNGKFRDISKEAGIITDSDLPVTDPRHGPGPKWGMGIVVCDFDGDGWPDIYVANDVSDNFLLKNTGKGAFEHLGLELGAAVSTDGTEQGSMGVTAGDFDRDGGFDLLVTNYHKQLNALYHHEGDPGFSDQALGKGLGESTIPKVSWGTKLFDADADGWLDLFIANGHLEDNIRHYDDSSEYEQKNQLFRNVNGKFVEIGDQAGSALQEKLSSRGAAFGDIDNDGDIDIVVCNSRGAPSLLINERSNTNSWVRLKLVGKKNLFAIGARVTITAGGATQTDEIRSGGSYCSQNDLRVFFGLGDAKKIDSIEVRWPGGETKVYEGLDVDRQHELAE